MTHASESGHFYTRLGEPVYEVLLKNGKLAAPSLREARPNNWVPGVSTILAMEAKPQLIEWLIDQALMSAVTLKRNEGEDEDQFIKRAKEDSRQQVKQAAHRGTWVHSLIQGAWGGKPYPLAEAPFVEPTLAWVKQRFGGPEVGWEEERPFASPKGYGGKADRVSFPSEIVLDVKTKDFDETDKWGKPVTGITLAWPENAMQLAAYSDGFGFKKPSCANIFVSRTVPGLIRVREYDTSEIDEAREAFHLLHRLWCIRKKFDPSFTREVIAA